MRCRWLSCLFALLVLVGCRESAKPDELFEVSGRLVVFNYRVAVATLLVTLAPRQAVGEGQVAVARFDNPAGGEAIIVRQKIWPKLGRVTLETPPVTCIKRDHTYKVAIAIQGADGTTLQTLKTSLISSEDQDVLPDRPLVVGPGYKPNPELAGHPGGKLPGERPHCPANREQ